jgi:DNA-binding winged helix-turn-helix (wHTH) protein/tetratricopeptide (TPR) repeat protein
MITVRSVSTVISILLGAVIHFSKALPNLEIVIDCLPRLVRLLLRIAEREASCPKRSSEVFREFSEIYQAVMSNQGKELYEFGPFRLDPGKRLLLRDNQPVPLQLKAFETLLVLIRNSERVVLKDDLMKAVWPDTFVEEANLAQNVFVLRKILGAKVGDHRYIDTIPGRGYRFTEKVRVISEEESLLVESHSRSRVVIEQSKPQRMPAIFVASVLVVLALGAAAGYRYYRGRQAGQTATALPAIGIKPRRSVAVLGFQNLSGRSDPAWLSTAFSEMLTTELGTGDQLRMVSAEEVAQLKSSLPLVSGGTLSRDTLARIHQTLGADVVVLGSYSDLGKQSRGQIRLDMRLQDTAAGETVATISETGTEADLFQLVSRAGARLREKVAIPAISGDQAAGVQAALPSNTEAARLYAEGLEKLRQFDALAARNFLQQAIQADSAYALAHAALAEALSRLGFEGRAKTEARKSFELSDKLPRKDRLFIEARYRAMNNEWDKALELYHSLFNFFPDDIEYGLRLADAQTQAGKRNDAMTTIQLLRQLPPPARDDARIDLAEEMNYIRLGQYSMARAVAVRAVEKTRASGFDLLLARALYLEAATLAPLGEGDKAIAAAEEAKKIYSQVGDQWGVSNALEYIAFVYAERGDREAAEKLYQQALAVNRAIGSKTGAAVDLTSIAADRETQGDVDGGKKLDEEALAIYREIGDRNREAWALMGVAWAVAAEGDPAASLRMDDEALAIFIEMADDRGIAYALTEKTSSLTLLGDLGKAKQASQHSLDLALKSGEKTSMFPGLFYLGNIAKLEGKLEEARKKFSEALSVAHSVDDPARSSEAEFELGDVAVEEGHSSDARQHVQQGLSYLHGHKDPDDEITAHILLARLALAEGKTREAVEAMNAARPLFQQSPDWEGHMIFGITDGRIQAATGKLTEARESIKKVLAEAGKRGVVRYELEARLALCEIEAKTDPSTARAHAKTLEAEARSKGFGLIARKALALGA